MLEIWAEAGPCRGSVEYAIECADAVARAGADALKVQWYTAETIASPEAVRYDRTGGDAVTQAELFEDAIYPYERWKPVIERCAQRGIEFIPAVFDHEAADMAWRMGVKHVKVASGDITNLPLIEQVGDQYKKLTLSTGGATMDEVTAAVNIVPRGVDLTLLACHLEYPTEWVDAHLGRIVALKQEWGTLVRVGYSNHTPWQWADHSVTVAMLLGAEVLEQHFTLEKGETGDDSFAVDPVDLLDMVKVRGELVAAIGNVELVPSPGEQAAIVGARRSLYAATDLPKGHVLEPGDLIALRPGGGISPAEEKDLIGQRVMVEIGFGELIDRRSVGGVGASLSVE